MSHSAPPRTPAPTASPGCARCGGNNAVIAECEQEIRALARFIERGGHTLRGRTALAQLPAAKERLRAARQSAITHAVEVHGEVS